MPTKKKNITGYVDKDIYKKFREHCDRQQTTISKALETILTEYFELEENKDTIESLSEKVKKLSLRVSDLENSKSQVKQKYSTGNTNNEVKYNTSNVQSKTNHQKGDSLNTAQLAKRFAITRSSINEQKRNVKNNKKTKQQYLDWTRSKDPDNLAWDYEGSKNFVV